MEESKALYQALMTKAIDHVDTDDTLSLCRIISSILVRIPALSALPLPVLFKYHHVTHFKRITELTVWLKDITNCIDRSESLIDSGLLIDGKGRRISLDLFNTTPTSIVVTEKDCLTEINIRLNQLWRKTRTQQSYYARVLNPSLVHLYNYLMVYIRIIEDEQRQDESDTRRSRQDGVSNQQPAIETDANNTV